MTPWIKFSRLKIAPRADEADARKNSQGKAHEIEHDERIGRFSGRRHQQIGLNHREAGGEGDENRRAQSGRMTALATIETNRRADTDRQCDPLGDVRPCQRQRHRPFPAVVR